MKTLLFYTAFAGAIIQVTVLRYPLPDELHEMLDNLNTGTDTSGIDTLLEIAKNGLKPKVGDETAHVVIVGAGIAGLTAGYTLKKAGYDITIIEASDRAGGRIQTLYGDGWYAELGPMRIPEKHYFTNTWVHKFNLTYREFIEENPNTWYYVNGEKVRKWIGDANPQLLKYPTYIEEDGKNAGDLFNEALKKLDTNADNCATDIECLKKYDRFNVKSWLVEEAGLSDGAVAMIGILLNEDNLMFTSLSESIILQYQLNLNQTIHEIIGGHESLPRAISPYIEDDIIYNARVTQVSQNEDGVSVTYDGGTVSGTHVIMTTTMQSAAFITFEPQLTFLKKDAIKNIHYITLLKVIMVFEEPFWKEDGITGGRTITDLPIRFIYYPSHLPERGPYPLLVSYTISDDADKFDGLSDEFILRVVLDNLATIHGQHVYGLYTGTGLVKNWRIDPYSLGGVVVFTPFQTREYYNALQTPDGRIYFCGETDFPRGWIDTSIKTAMRVVCQISGQYKTCEPGYIPEMGNNTPALSCGWTCIYYLFNVVFGLILTKLR